MGHVPAERFVDLLLPGAIGEVIVAADDVADVHIVVVDHDGQHVGRIAVGAQQHQIVEVGVLPDDAACTWSSITVSPASGALEPDHRLDPGRRVGRVAVAPASVVKLGAALAPCGLAHGGEFLRRGVTAIGLALGQELLGDLAVALRARKLEHDVAVPGEAEPGQPVDDGGDRRRGSNARGRYPRFAAASCRRSGAHRAS